MSAYSSFVMEFDNWKSSNEITDNGRYGWKLGSNAQAQFKKHLDDEGGDLFDATVKQRFVSMFDKNQSMMGINVLGIDTVNKNKVYLYKISEGQNHVTINDVKFLAEKELFSKKLLKDPMGGYISWKYVIKEKSVTLKDSKNSYTDSADDEEKGSFLGNDNGISVWGNVNYVNGKLTIHRLSNNNANNASKLEEQYEKVLSTNISSLTSSYSSVSGLSNSSSSGSAVGQMLNLNKITLDKDNFDVTYTTYIAPLTIVWEYTISE